MVRTLSLEGTMNNIKGYTHNSIITKFISNPVLLSLLIVTVIVLILYNSLSIKINSTHFFKNIIFSILITCGLIFCHNNIIKKSVEIKGKGELTSYFSDIAGSSNSNIDNIEIVRGSNENSSYQEIDNGGLDNLDIHKFWEN